MSTKPTAEQEAAAINMLHATFSRGKHTAGTASLVARLVAERDALANFKAYVHQRLDDAGVPIDPDSPHKAAGCRIGGRLDFVLAERDAARAELALTRCCICGCRLGVGITTPEGMAHPLCAPKYLAAPPGPAPAKENA